MTRKRVYISLPISKGEANHNYHIGNVVQNELIQAGYAAFNPGLSVANYGAQRDLTWDDWLENDEAWVAVSDLVVRLPGASMGAERECEFARLLRIPIVGVAYFFPSCPALKELFPDEHRITYTREDALNLERFNRAERRAAGLPAWDENDPRLLSDIQEGFERARQAI